MRNVVINLHYLYSSLYSVLNIFAFMLCSGLSQKKLRSPLDILDFCVFLLTVFFIHTFKTSHVFVCVCVRLDSGVSLRHLCVMLVD